MLSQGSIIKRERERPRQPRDKEGIFPACLKQRTLVKRDSVRHEKENVSRHKHDMLSSLIRMCDWPPGNKPCHGFMHEKKGVVTTGEEKKEAFSRTTTAAE